MYWVIWNLLYTQWLNVNITQSRWSNEFMQSIDRYVVKKFTDQGEPRIERSPFFIPNGPKLLERENYTWTMVVRSNWFSSLCYTICQLTVPLSANGCITIAKRGVFAGWTRQISFTARCYEKWNDIHSQNNGAQRSDNEFPSRLSLPELVESDMGLVIDFWIRSRMLY
jgi:hypothetical protein